MGQIQLKSAENHNSDFYCPSCAGVHTPNETFQGLPVLQGFEAKTRILKCVKSEC